MISLETQALIPAPQVLLHHQWVHHALQQSQKTALSLRQQLSQSMQTHPTL